MRAPSATLLADVDVEEEDEEDAATSEEEEEEAEEEEEEEEAEMAVAAAFATATAGSCNLRLGLRPPHRNASEAPSPRSCSLQSVRSSSAPVPAREETSENDACWYPSPSTKTPELTHDVNTFDFFTAAWFVPSEDQVLSS